MQPQHRYIIGSLVIILAAFIVAIAFNGRSTPTRSTQNQEEEVAGEDCHNFSETHVQVGDIQVPIALADTKEEHAQGLSGCAAVPEGKGMYFTFTPRSTATFWMKDMIIPIDILWIRDGKVAGIEASVPAEIGVADSDLARYRHSQAIDGALELAAGQAAILGIQVGDEVAF
ncbi:MAG: DUF192 domain-containing protein [Candidatus Andersenbacteria bacterium]|nr:DUF192 domain-containing protein [Candidatus Andersenbacteria bacterium]MBI3250445.1 DUF192 domain-containing protein [Candidatus Andersenbacteria bacterium]